MCVYVARRVEGGNVHAHGVLSRPVAADHLRIRLQLEQGMCRTI